MPDKGFIYNNWYMGQKHVLSTTGKYLMKPSNGIHTKTQEAILSSWSEKILPRNTSNTYAPCIYSFSCFSCIDYFGRRAAFIEGFSCWHMFACCRRRGWVCISSLIYKPRFLGRDILSFIRPCWWTCRFLFLLRFISFLPWSWFRWFRKPNPAFLGHIPKIWRISQTCASFNPKTEMTSQSSSKENTKWKCKRVADDKD